MKEEGKKKRQTKLTNSSQVTKLLKKSYALPDPFQRVLKFIPKVLFMHELNIVKSKHIVEQTGLHGEDSPDLNRDQRIRDQDDSEIQLTLPLCQSLGQYLNYLGKRQSVLPVLQSFLQQWENPSTVILSVRIDNFYEQKGNDLTQRYFDEYKYIQDHQKLSEQFLKVINEQLNILMNEQKEALGHPDHLFGEVLIVQPDEIVIGFSLETLEDQPVKIEEELVEIQDQGYDQGYDQEQNQYQNQGYDQDYNQDYNQGYDQDYNQGYNQGYNQNPNQGYDQNPNQGYNQNQDYSQNPKQNPNQVKRKPQPPPQPEQKSQPKVICKKVVLFAQKLFYLVDNLLKEQKDTKKQVAIGLGYGSAMICHIGGIKDRNHWFLVGEALGDAQNSAFLSCQQNGIILSKPFWRALEDQILIDSDEVPVHDQERRDLKGKLIHVDGYCRVTLSDQILQGIFSGSHPMSKDKEKKKIFTFTNDKASEILRREVLYLEGSLNNPLIKSLYAQHMPSQMQHVKSTYAKQKVAEQWVPDLKSENHFRVVTVMVMSLELEGAFDSEDSLFVLQTSIEIIQKQIFRMRGTITNLVFEGSGMQDRSGGLIIEAVWGLSDQEDPALNSSSLACYAGVFIKKALKEFIAFSNPELQNTTTYDELDFSISQQRKQTFKTMALAKSPAKNLAGMSLGDSTMNTIYTDSELPINIGIASGKVMQCVQGDDNLSNATRLSPQMIGLPFIRAKQLQIFSSSDCGKTYIDFNTMQLASSDITFKYLGHRAPEKSQFKIGVYEADMLNILDQLKASPSLNVKEVFKQFESDFVLQGSQLRISHNPIILDNSSKYSKQNNNNFGRRDQVKRLMREIVAHINAANAQAVSLPNNSQQSQGQKRGSETQAKISLHNTSVPGLKPKVIILRGGRGCGKSLFARNLLINLKQLELLIAQKIKQANAKALEKHYQNMSSSGLGQSALNATSMNELQNNKTHVKFRFCTSSCSPETSLQFLGAWRQIFRLALSHIANILDKKPRKALAILIEKNINTVGNKLQFVKDFLNIHDLDSDLAKSLEKKYKQVVPTRENGFDEPARFAEEVQEDFVVFLLSVLLQFQEIVREAQGKLAEKGFKVNQGVVFVIDNTQYMNASDWRFLKEFLEIASDGSLNSYTLVLNTLSSEPDFADQKISSDLNILVSSYARDYYRSTIWPMESSLFNEQHTLVVDFDPLKEEDLKKMIMELSKEYFKQNLANIDKLAQGTGGKDPNSGKAEDHKEDAEHAQESNLIILRRQLSWKFQVLSQFSEVSPEVVRYLWQSSHGNPLTASALFYAHLTNGFFEVDSQQAVVMNKKMQETRKLRYFEFKSQQPLLLFKQAQTLFDYEMRALSKAPEVMNCCAYVAKCAAMNGFFFSLKTLQESNLCPSVFVLQRSEAYLRDLVSQLENMRLVELVDEQPWPVLRFTSRALQHAIVQRWPHSGAAFEYLVDSLCTFHQRVNTLDLTVHFSRKSDVHQFKKYLAIKNNFISEEKLNKVAEVQMIQKETSVQIEKLADQRQLEVNCIREGIQVEAKAIDQYISLKNHGIKQEWQQNQHSRKKKQTIPQYQRKDLKLRLQLLAQNLNGKDTFRLLVSNSFEVPELKSGDAKEEQIFRVNVAEMQKINEVKSKLQNDTMLTALFQKGKDKKKEVSQAKRDQFLIEIEFARINPKAANESLTEEMTTESLTLIFESQAHQVKWLNQFKYLKERLQFRSFTRNQAARQPQTMQIKSSHQSQGMGLFKNKMAERYGLKNFEDSSMINKSGESRSPSPMLKGQKTLRRSSIINPKLNLGPDPSTLKKQALADKLQAMFNFGMSTFLRVTSEAPFVPLPFYEQEKQFQKCKPGGEIMGQFQEDVARRFTLGNLDNEDQDSLMTESEISGDLNKGQEIKGSSGAVKTDPITENQEESRILESLIESIKNHHSLKSDSEADNEKNMADLITPGGNYELTNQNTMARQSKAQSLDRQPLGEEYPVSESQEMLGIEEIQQDSQEQPFGISDMIFQPGFGEEREQSQSYESEDSSQILPLVYRGFFDQNGSFPEPVIQALSSIQNVFYEPSQQLMRSHPQFEEGPTIKLFQKHGADVETLQLSLQSTKVKRDDGDFLNKMTRSKKVFTDKEISEFKLKRRHNPQLHDLEVSYILKGESLEEDDTEDSQIESSAKQGQIAEALTKILDQRSRPVYKINLARGQRPAMLQSSRSKKLI